MEANEKNENFCVETRTFRGSVIRACETWKIGWAQEPDLLIALQVQERWAQRQRDAGPQHQELQMAGSTSPHSPPSLTAVSLCPVFTNCVTLGESLSLCASVSPF